MIQVDRRSEIEFGIISLRIFHSCAEARHVIFSYMYVVVS
jgi:hypothetical protein